MTPPSLHTVRQWGAALAPALLVGLAPPSMAVPYVWLEAGPGGAQARTGMLLPPVSGEVPPPPLLVDPRASLGKGKSLALTEKAGGYAIALPAGAAPEADLRFTARARDDKGLPTVYWARHGRAETQPVNELELVPTTPGGSTFRLFFKGTAVPATQVNVETSAGWRRTLRAEADGTVSLASPEYPRLFASRYVLEASARVTGRFVQDGKTFDTAVYTTTLSFDVAP